jgi:hypothetical protein
MQVELLDRHRWRTRVELANAIFEYLEVFHNRQRRHSSLGMLTPIQFEHASTVAENPTTRLHETWGHSKASKIPGRFMAILSWRVSSILRSHPAGGGKRGRGCGWPC